ncbi:hypothetical protein C8R45DRAFT_1189105 [Mycena sanguinolenta]|nr:hypothetical protein C8R45DRAFT_1189105 [Mycena sanguinolenta]
MSTQERLDAFPVLTLPSEITSEIFTRFIPAYPSPPPLTGPLSPTTLTHVCHDWREIAQATPALWRAISLPLELSKRGRLCIVRSWLTRSGCLPLSFEIEGISWNVVLDKELEALLLHRARWEYVTLALSPTASLDPEIAMPVLRQLEIRVDHYAPTSGWGPPTQFHEPRLRSVTLWQCFSVTDIFMPWTQLTSLTLVDQPFFCCPAILQHTPNLVRCHLALCVGAGIPVPEVRLPFLESLVFTENLDNDDDDLDDEDEDRTDMTQYLNCLLTPALCTLVIPDAFLWPNPVEAFAGFISHSGSRLQGLCITGHRAITRKVYRRTFSNIPELSFDKISGIMILIHSACRVFHCPLSLSWFNGKYPREKYL